MDGPHDLEELLIERGLITRDYIDTLKQSYETEIGPMIGARIVARAWIDPAYRKRLLANGRQALAELSIGGPEIEYLHVVENSPAVHNVVVCTSCSSYPRGVLGLPPAWYKDPAYRSRMMRQPRVLLAEMGCPMDHEVDIEIWDSSAQARYLVLPERPAGTENLTEQQLAALVTRDAMIGVQRL